jgi:hypothetical protein
MSTISFGWPPFMYKKKEMMNKEKLFKSQSLSLVSTHNTLSSTALRASAERREIEE